MRIISDTTCHFTIEEANEHQVILVPNQISVGEKTYRDYLDIDSESFMKLIEDQAPTTSQPSVGDVMEAYEACGQEETLHITTGKGLSSAYDSACGVKQSMNANHVTILSSASVAGPNRYLAQLAVELSKKLDSVQEVVNRLQHCIQDSQSYVIPVNFKFLQRSGRLTPSAAVLGSFLKLKPIMAQSANKERIDRFSVARTWDGAIKAVVDDLIKRGVSAKHRIYVAHAFNVESAKLAIEAIKSRIKNADIETFVLAPAMITHGGPHCLVIQYILKDEQ